MVINSTLSPPSFQELCFTKRIALFAAIDVAAISAWISTVNWIAVSTTIGVVILNLTLGVTAAMSHFRSQKIKWKKAIDESMKDTLSQQLEDARKEAADARAEATEQRAEMLARITEKDSRLAMLISEMQKLNESIAKERVSIHSQREEMNRASLYQTQEVVELRKQLRETMVELSAARRELFDARRQGGGMVEDIANRVGEKIASVVETVAPNPPTNNAPNEE